MVLVSGYKMTYTLRDHKQQTATLNLYIDGTYATAAAAAGHAQVMATDLYALQTGNTVFLNDGTTPSVRAKGVFTSQAQPWNNTYNSSGAYHAVEDKAIMVFTDSAGSRHQYQVACPLTSIFLTDQETIDTSQTVVKQFVADMLAATYNGTAPNAAATKAVVNATGTSLKFFIGGFRIRRKMQRRMTIYTLNASENGPAE